MTSGDHQLTAREHLSINDVKLIEKSFKNML
jgi:hypothetical protein